MSNKKKDDLSPLSRDEQAEINADLESLSEQWQRETQEFFNKNPVSRESSGSLSTWRPGTGTSNWLDSDFSTTPTYYHTSSRNDLNRWRTGSGNYSFTSFFAGKEDSESVATLVADAVVRVANAVTNKAITIEGKEQFLSLQIGDAPHTPGALLANTSLNSTVFMSLDWINDASNINGGLFTLDHEKANKNINDLNAAYTGLALTLATAKRTMKPEVCKQAIKLVRKDFKHRTGHPETMEGKTLVELASGNATEELVRALAIRPGLILWQEAEHKVAREALLSDWPGFDDYVSAAASRQDAQTKLTKISDQLSQYMPWAEKALNDARIELQKSTEKLLDLKGEPGKASAVVDMIRHIKELKEHILQTELDRMDVATQTTAMAMAYTLSGEKGKVAIPDWMLQGVKHGLSQVRGLDPSTSLLDQGLAIGNALARHYHKLFDPPEPEEGGGGEGKQKNPSAEGASPGEGTPDGQGNEIETPFTVNNGSPSDSNPPSASDIIGSNPNISGTLGSGFDKSSDLESSEKPLTVDMQPGGIDSDPTKLGGSISNEYGLTRGFLISGYPKVTESQVELLRQIATPMAKAVRQRISFRASKPSYEVVGLRKGDIDEGALHLAGKDERVFSRREEVSKPTLVVGLLVDQSGSMNADINSSFKPDLPALRRIILKELPDSAKSDNDFMHRLHAPESYLIPTLRGGSHYPFGSGSITGSSSPRPNRNGVSVITNSTLSRMDQVTAVAAAIALGLDGIHGVETYACGFFSSYGNKNINDEKVMKFAKMALPYFYVDHPFASMAMFEYLSREVGPNNPAHILRRLAMTRCGHANADGFAIMHAVARLSQLYPDVPNRLLFVLSDGQPSSNGSRFKREGSTWIYQNGSIGREYEGRNAMMHMRSVNQWARTHHKVKVMGIGVDSAFSALEGRLMYGENNFTVIDDVFSAAPIIAAFLARTFHRLGA